MPRRRPLPPRLALAIALVLLAAILAAPVPVLDEESHLAIGAMLDPWRPYDWWRPWPPWNGGREADAFVYAHPPLFSWWVRAWVSFAGTDPAALGALKVAAALPWVGLFGWSAGRLAERLVRRPWPAVLAVATAPAVVLVLQRGLMPDAMALALQAFAVAAWVEGLSGERPAPRWLAAGGLALALAAWTKYPALLVVPALLLHCRDRRTWPFWAAAVVAWGGGEAWIGWTYGRPHLWEVLSRAGEIPRGPLDGRVLGVAVRLALGLSALPMLAAGWRRAWPVAAGIALLAVVVGAPEGTDLDKRLALVLFATMGLATLAPAVRGWRLPEGPLLAAWALAVVLGVVFAHNFAAPRYLAPAVLPLALLTGAAVEARPSGRALVVAGAAVQGALALGLSVGEHRFARAADAVAIQAADRYLASGWFTGEWTFRWRMERRGWRFLSGDPPPRAIVAVPANSSPAELPAGWEEVERHASGDRFPFRVVSAAEGVGLYGETTGALPFGWSRAPLEEAVVWRTP